MPRAMMAGTTDYSHQSFEDMVADLKDWVKNLTETCEALEKSETHLKEKDYWKKVNIDVQMCFGYSLKFFKTSIEEINSILEDFQEEIQGNHITRIRSLAQTAKRLDRDLAQVWHQDPWDGDKDYGNPDFAVVEHMYTEARGMTADMIDLGNLAARLEDFTGKRGKPLNEPTSVKINTAPPEIFVDLTRLDELRAIRSTNFDLSKLIRLCEELNTCYATGCYMATAMLGRAILDHIPPIFGLNNFAEVSSNYRGSRSFKESMVHLEKSLRNIADHHLHVQIRNSESLPTKTQVNFSTDLDVLLSEIIRLLKQP